MFAFKAGSEQGTFAEYLPAVRQWLATERGQFLLRTEQRDLDLLLPRMFGHHASTLGILPDASLLEATQIVHKTFLTPLEESGGPETIRLSVTEWPVQPRSMNMVLLHHVLEFSEKPHRTLREACRAIMPGGRLVIVGFNPLSLWNPVRMLGCGEDRIIRRARFFAPRRINDWLTLLNFRQCHLHFGGALFPLTTRLHPLRRKRVETFFSTSRIPMGSFYIMVAVKERSGLIPYDRRWRSTGNRLFGSTACTAGDLMKENT
ncbi:class I SAM-dependent methyltransferase [Sansalvadorimonas sp. 2012CJ34-2]|uniref:Class I SAM-dependent methyltransferase n=1 Tax=Parendozoicomonas callyspongiae TaxID=2942213 RepID=A0ABT0PEM4_9GAMM|nr:methyltransferase domain-containing protein [Sansalvadorimonas sp. 2012CJ34-2]MCL6269839.1 class I SAM-dependent methyltransferase [Sansalvadorimonas sp. 2012CJ34-2]